MLLCTDCSESHLIGGGTYSRRAFAFSIARVLASTVTDCTVPTKIWPDTVVIAVVSETHLVEE